jgi:serine/threonine-protein kinase
VLCPKCATVATATATVCPKCGTPLAANGAEDSTATSKKPRPAGRPTDKMTSLDKAVALQEGEAASSTAPFKAFAGGDQGATIMDLDSEMRTLDGPPNLKTGERLALQPKPEPPPPKPVPALVGSRRGPASGLRAAVPTEGRKSALATHQAAAAAAVAANAGAVRKDPLIGEKLGEYIVEEKIGTGGMGVVYRARQPQISGTVAIKVLRGDVIADKRDMERLLDEARVVNAIKHRGIINIFGAGELPDGRQYLVMEYLEGETLEKRLERVGKFTTEEALPILDEVLAALAAAHSTGIVHRDLKPANVFLVKQSDGPDLVKLLDFGLARRQMQEVSRIAGTPDYISPEHARGRPAGPPADLYGFGILAFHLLTGQLPFKGNTPMEMMEKHVHMPPPVPMEVNKDIPTAISGLILALLEKDPAARPDAAQAKVDLKAALKQIQQLADKKERNAVTEEQPMGSTPKDGMMAMTASSSAELDPRLKVLAAKADRAQLMSKVTRNWPWVVAALGVIWLMTVILYMSLSGPVSQPASDKPLPIPVVKKPPPPPGLPPLKAAVDPQKTAEVPKPVEPVKPPEPPKPVEPAPPPPKPAAVEPAPPPTPNPEIVPAQVHTEKSIATWRRKTLNDLMMLDADLTGPEREAYRPALNNLRSDVEATTTGEALERNAAHFAELRAKLATIPP